MDKDKTYPDNLLADIFDTPAVEPFALMDDANLAIEYILRLLKEKKERQYQVVEMRYKQGMTYAAIGSRLNITVEGVRQANKEALKYLRNPQRLNFLKYGLVYMLSTQIEQAKNCAYKEGFADGLAVGIKEGAEKEPGHLSCSRDAIRLDALGLSTRSRNALYRAGKRTAGEIAALTYYDLASIVNLGTKCYSEIADKMRSLGYDVTAMQPPARGSKSTVANTMH